MSVTGATATSVKGDRSVFYNEEILAIVHRAKVASSGLVETTLWAWQGRRSEVGEREERKLKDMARHYGTKLYLVHQGCEPTKLVHALGGRLAIRQVRSGNVYDDVVWLMIRRDLKGSRSHWSAENTTMHQVRLMDGKRFIDEHDLVSDNHCREDGFAR
jgi:hypothetical protein